MREDRALLLMADFAGIIKKHGSTALSDLTELLKDENRIDQLISLLEIGTSATGAAKRSSRRKTVEHKAGKTSKRRVQEDFDLEDSPKRELATALYEGLASKRMLPALNDIRSFTRDNGLAPVIASSRDKALKPFVRDVISRSAEEIEIILKQLHTFSPGLADRSLEGWASVILDKQRPPDA